VSHAKQRHGKYLGHSSNKFDIYKAIGKLLSERKQYKESLALICNYCKEAQASPSDFFLHNSVAHSYADLSPTFCCECYRPVLNGNLLVHLEAAHDIRCTICLESYRSIDVLMRHCISRHGYEYLSTLSAETRSMLVEASQQNTIFTRISNGFPILLSPWLCNEIIPDVFSDEFTTIIDNIGCHNNALISILIPYTELSSLKRTLLRKFPPCYQDYTTLRDIIFQDEITKMLTENFQKLQYEYKEIFKTEISEVSTMGCCTCLNNDNHDSDKSKCLEFYKTNSYVRRGITDAQEKHQQCRR
jgi:hypothetical protein